MRFLSARPFDRLTNPPRRPVVRPGLPALAVLAFVMAPGSAAAQDAPAWKAALDYRVGDGTYWWTSNARYAGNGAEAPAYGTAWVYGVGGTSVRGCLFAEVDGGTPLQWEFFQGWDPAEHKLYSFQSAESGAVGVGYEALAGVGETAEMEQVFAWPGAAPQRIRHLTEHVHQDTMVTRSFAWVDDGWQPQRTYTWIRRPGDARQLCANLD